MNKAPQGQVVRQRPSVFPWRRVQQTVGPIVAEPLTEDEAAAEMAAHREAEQAARRAQEETIRQRVEARQTRAEQKRLKGEARRRRQAERVQQLREYASSSPEPRPGTPWRLPVVLSRGRLLFSVGTAGCAVLIASTCLLMLGAYSLGRRSEAGTRSLGLTTAAAVKSGAQSPLLPDQTPPAISTKPPLSNPDLSELLKVPAARRESGVTANQPASVATAPPAAESAASSDRESLNYLQIESFRITRDRSSEQLREDVATAKAFLATRGVKTFARRLSNGYVLFGEQGFPPGPEYEAQRAAFRKKIDDLGKEYRAAGGDYRFKDPLFVSYSITKTGQPE